MAAVDEAGSPGATTHAAARSPAATVNGAAVSLRGVGPQTSALDWLRAQGLTAAKEGCAEGECGACAILVVRPVLDGVDGRPADQTRADRTAPPPSQWTAVNACLVPAASLVGQEVVTCEGLGSPDALHPVQRELALGGGSQCGYCTPGFVCSMAAEYYRPGSDGFDLEALSGNLCRCTGYRPIRDAALALGSPGADDVLAGRCQRPAPRRSSQRVDGPGGTYHRAAVLVEALELLAAKPGAMVVAGGTDWGVEVNLRGARREVLIGIDAVPELRTLDVGVDTVKVGAGLTLSEIEGALGDRVPLLAQLMPQFASRLIRNSATLGGNLATASPIGDAAPVLLALDATIVLASLHGERVVPLAEFFTGYRESVLRAGELIRSVLIPLPLAGVAGFHKITKRRFDDISSVAIATAITLSDGMVTRARIGLGGVAPTPVRALATEAALEGRPWDRDTVEAAAAVLRGEGSPLDDHRATAAYRTAMLGTSLLRLHADHPTDRQRPTVEMSP
ncbi:FAD binding domain-containing protein [Intrasporangium calvum]|uniref:FAD binding domain-containing protein n=1 Tax=Intrasporangium calvum TaxID=53358 RepID=A0ABT5GI69_9MICO|nr:FAD binding domain-containing protein [Intrasporangium calvum]MDC5697540.1 FAD binding domain-containing protein [Intrasporangium calvum]